MIHKYQGEGDFKGHRFHLRIDESGSGVLVMDASRMLYLNGTALSYVKCILGGTNERKTVKYIRKRYRKLRKPTIRRDLNRIKSELLEFVNGDDSSIEVMMTDGTDPSQPGGPGLPAPYRMDLALTYHCQNSCVHCYNEKDRSPEKNGEEGDSDEKGGECKEVQYGAEEHNERLQASGGSTEGNHGGGEDNEGHHGGGGGDHPTASGKENENVKENVKEDVNVKGNVKENENVKEDVKGNENVKVNENVREPANKLDLNQWETVLQTLWNHGVPHIVFTGGEPTLSPYLRPLIEYSEQVGQITGLITNGRKLKEPGYLRDLVDAGLDHVQITVLSHDESVHDELVGCHGAWKETIEGLKTAIKEDIYVVTNTTITRSNIRKMEETMLFLIDLGVKHIACNSIIRSGKGKDVDAVGFEELRGTLLDLEIMAQAFDVDFIWYTPTPYCELDPVTLGLGVKQCTACTINMAIEPDGSVLPCQSYYEKLGNILTDQWDSIWNHDICERIRDRDYVLEKCESCDQLATCGGGCPLSLVHGDYVCLERSSTG